MLAPILITAVVLTGLALSRSKTSTDGKSDSNDGKAGGKTDVDVKTKPVGVKPGLQTPSAPPLYKARVSSPSLDMWMNRSLSAQKIATIPQGGVVDVHQVELDEMGGDCFARPGIPCDWWLVTWRTDADHVGDITGYVRAVDNQGAHLRGV